MENIKLTMNQARKFILLKEGLYGDFRYHGASGVMEFIREAGCIQFDPIDICGKNPELVLQSRVAGFKKEMLYDLLYEDRRLFDYFDKNLCIMPIEDWIYFKRFRDDQKMAGKSHDEVDAVSDQIKSTILENGHVSSKTVNVGDHKIDWYWNHSKLSRVALETLYFRGDLVIHHKKGTIKHYALATDFIDEKILNAPDPFIDDLDHRKWRILRRIGSAGLLWNRPSDAWLGIQGLKTFEREKAFNELLFEGKIQEIEVQGIEVPLYAQSSDLDLMHQSITDDDFPKRLEFIAPLDNLIWDRRLIKTLFGFEYTWEIYTPLAKRKYGYYVLPVLFGLDFTGRIEIICDRKKKSMRVHGLWLEEGFVPTDDFKIRLTAALERFRIFNGMKDIIFEIEW